MAATRSSTRVPGVAYATDDFSAIDDRDTRERVLRAMLLFAGATIDVKDRARSANMVGLLASTSDYVVSSAR